MKWIYSNKPFYEELSNNYFGFVYLCEEIPTGKKYIGRKNFLAKKTRPPLKGSKRKRRSKVDSGWRDYCTSNSIIIEKCKNDGYKNFTWTILHLVESQTALKYLEAKEIMMRDAVLLDTYYNMNVQIKLIRKNK
jgi:hypothetical protein